jgi:hypothetical protein
MQSDTLANRLWAAHLLMTLSIGLIANALPLEVQVQPQQRGKTATNASSIATLDKALKSYERNR